MAIIHVSGSIGKIIFIPPKPSENKEAVLNVGVCERQFRNGHPKSVWYQAVWTGEEAIRKQKIMNRIKAISVTGKEDFRIRRDTDKIELERTIWVMDETLHWKEKDQLELQFPIEGSK